MNTPESNDSQGYKLDPDRLMSYAEQGFQLSYAFVRPDADRIRQGAAATFEMAAGALLYEKLAALGMTDAQIEELAESGPDAAEEALQRLAPDEMADIRKRVQEMAADPHALNALQDTVYITDKEFGRTKND